MVGFVGFEGFTDRRSAGKCFAHAATRMLLRHASTQIRDKRRHHQQSLPGGRHLVGFVGFEGFTDRQSASQRFAQVASLHPAGTHTNSNLRYPKRTTYKAYKLVFIGGFVGS